MKKKTKITDDEFNNSSISEDSPSGDDLNCLSIVQAEAEDKNVLKIDEEDDLLRHRKTPQPIEEMLNLALNDGYSASASVSTAENSTTVTTTSSTKSSPMVRTTTTTTTENSSFKQRTPSKPNSSASANSSRPFVMLNADSPFAETTRSIYLGNLLPGCSVRDICDLVRGERGLESVRLLPEKSCAFVDFISRQGAERFIQRARRSRILKIANQEVKLGWAKEKVSQATVLKAIENGATRNIYFSFPAELPDDPLLITFNDYLRDSGNTDDNGSTSTSSLSDYFTPPPSTTEMDEITSLEYPLVSFLFGIFDEFGPLDMIKVVPSRRIAFIHMAMVADAIRAVAELPTRNEFRGKRIAFGRDRCGERLVSPVVVAAAVTDSESVESVSETASFVNQFPEYMHNHAVSSSFAQLPSRTVYLGNCNSPEISIEDLCDHIHTGQIQSVRLNRERRCAFVTFISSQSAELFLGRALQFGLMIRNCQLKPAFAKENNNNTTSSNNNNNNNNSSTGTSTGNCTLPLAISNALRKGYTRNLYLGNVDFTVLTESRLRTEMSRFGPLDRIQILKDRGVAFVHFANLLDGGRAFEQIKGDLCYRNCRVGFGKDRCEPANGTSSSTSVGAPNIINSNTNNTMYNMNNYLSNYPPPPFNPHPSLYFLHPMMYDPSNVLYPSPGTSNADPSSSTEYVMQADAPEFQLPDHQQQQEEEEVKNPEE